MIKNEIHYQITGDFNTDFGTVISNPIIKISVDSTGVISTGLLQCEYNVYISAETYENGYYFFKGHYNGSRLVNFTYPIADVPNWGIQTYKQDQRKIIADTFGYDIANVVLVEEQE
tara:strand:+ start:24474 stop:24821 length:348 start_codon:yes stop_codon:yes gene_type:complete